MKVVENELGWSLITCVDADILFQSRGLVHITSLSHSVLSVIAKPQMKGEVCAHLLAVFVSQHSLN